MKTPHAITKLQRNAAKHPEACFWTYLFMGEDFRGDDVGTPRTIYATAEAAYNSIVREHQCVHTEDLGEPLPETCAKCFGPIRWCDVEEVEFEDELQQGTYRLFSVRVRT